MIHFIQYNYFNDFEMFSLNEKKLQIFINIFTYYYPIL
jgi:hypothetical protein